MLPSWKLPSIMLYGHQSIKITVQDFSFSVTITYNIVISLLISALLFSCINVLWFIWWAFMERYE